MADEENKIDETVNEENEDENLTEEELESEIESEDLIEDRKFKFKQWLKESHRFSDNSVRNYSYYINYIKKHGYTEYDLYKINDITIIDELLIKFNNMYQIFLRKTINNF